MAERKVKGVILQRSWAQLHELLESGRLSRDVLEVQLEPVDLELVLLADATGSIDDDEIRFQRQGYAAALTHPQVLAAITDSLTGRIALTYVEWGDEFSQDVVVPWTVIVPPEVRSTNPPPAPPAPPGPRPTEPVKGRNSPAAPPPLPASGVGMRPELSP